MQIQALEMVGSMEEIPVKEGLTSFEIRMSCGAGFTLHGKHPFSLAQLANSVELISTISLPVWLSSRSSSSTVRQRTRTLPPMVLSFRELLSFLLRGHDIRWYADSPSRLVPLGSGANDPNAGNAVG